MRDNLFRIVDELNIIIYARLSKEEEGKTSIERSKSIQNQIDICRRYIDEEKKKYQNIKFNVVAELFDDGISGTTFERNDFKELIKMIESKQANMVITKDQSRFGREHIETDNYMEKWFPEHNVRFVAVIDGVDTYAKELANNDMAPIKNWMNEMYAKHTSKAVKATKRENAKKGIWNGGEPPLGLQIDKNNKGKLIIEPVGAEIVKKIFSLALQNKNPNRIADILIKENIPVPTMIKKNKRRLNLDLKDLWDRNTIKNILENEMYIGTMVQSKTTTLSHKSKKIVYLSKEDWICIPNKVPAIIDKKDFDNVQILLKNNKNVACNSYEYLLKGLLKCSECNHTIGVQHYKKRKNNYTICNYYRKYSKKRNVCTAHRFVYEKLEELVLKSIKDDCFNYVDLKGLSIKLQNKNKNKNLKLVLKQKLEESNNEINRLNEKLDKMYMRLDAGLIDEEQYVRMRKEIKSIIEHHKNSIESYKKEVNINENNQNIDYDKMLEEFVELQNPSKILISKLIESIYVSEDGVVNIYYKIRNPNI